MAVKIPISELINIEELHVHPTNVKEHPESQIKNLMKLIEMVGFKDPVIIDNTNTIRAGHGRVLAAKQLEMVQVPCVRLEGLTKEQMDLFVYMDNKINESPWIKENVELILKDIPMEELEVFELDWDEIKKPEYDEETDEVSEPPVEPKSKLGDIYQLDNHKIMCGDATKDIEKLLDGIDIDLLFTDPPYGINAVQNSRLGAKQCPTGFGKVRAPGLVKSRIYKKIIGDDKPFEPQFLLELKIPSIIFGGNHFASKLPDNACWLAWDKKDNAGAEGINYSDVELAWTNIHSKVCRIYRHLWSGLLRKGDRKTELKDRVHPTQKPVGLLADIIKDYSKKGQTVLDCYLGSGSMLIACEKTNRICFGMEIDCSYIDVILDRWSNFTNKDPVRISDGKKWSEIKNNN